MDLNKVFGIALIALSFGAAESAQAGGECERKGTSYICAGDTVYDVNDGWKGTVQGANPWTNQVTVTWVENGQGRYISRQTTAATPRTLAVDVGCLKRFCVGDRVYDVNDGWQGRIVGVNPYTNEAVINWNRNERRNYVDQRSAKSIERLALSRGCMHGFCVGDDVVDTSDGWRGRIVGIPSEGRQAVILWERNGMNRYVEMVSAQFFHRLTATQFCAEYGPNVWQRSSERYMPYPSEYNESEWAPLENRHFDEDSYYSVPLY